MTPPPANRQADLLAAIVAINPQAAKAVRLDRVHGLLWVESDVSVWFGSVVYGPTHTPLGFTHHVDDAALTVVRFVEVSTTISPLLDVADIALDFGMVNRSTLHPDGVTPESDATHTVMLCMALMTLSPVLTARFSGFDLGRALAMAVVHDLPEVHSGDVNTGPGGDKAAVANKAEADAEALEYVCHGLQASPGIVRTLRAYEEQHCVEAQVVRYVDKILPKLTHALNNAEALVQRGVGIAALQTHHEDQYAALGDEYPRVHAALGYLLNKAMKGAEDTLLDRIDTRERALDAAEQGTP